jgi:hypothetical protein
MNNSRTEVRSSTSTLDNEHHSEGGISNSSQPPPYPISLSHHQPPSAISSLKRTADDFDDSEEDERRVDAQAVEATTPRKSFKTELFDTPGMTGKSGNLQYNSNGLPTPETGGISLGRNLFGNPNESLAQKRKADNEFLDLVSPASTPTPARFKDVQGRVSDVGLFKDIALALQSTNVHLDDEATSVVKQVCSRYDRKAEGISQG